MFVNFKSVILCLGFSLCMCEDIQINIIFKNLIMKASYMCNNGEMGQ